MSYYNEDLYQVTDARGKTFWVTGVEFYELELEARKAELVEAREDLVEAREELEKGRLEQDPDWDEDWAEIRVENAEEAIEAAEKAILEAEDELEKEEVEREERYEREAEEEHQASVSYWLEQAPDAERDEWDEDEISEDGARIFLPTSMLDWAEEGRRNLGEDIGYERLAVWDAARRSPGILGEAVWEDQLEGFQDEAFWAGSTPEELLWAAAGIARALTPTSYPENDRWSPYGTLKAAQEIREELYRLPDSERLEALTEIYRGLRSAFTETGADWSSEDFWTGKTALSRSH